MEEKETKKEEEKFKPIAPYDLNEEQKRIVSKIDNHWKNDPCVKNDFPNMKEWAEWFYGNQYSENIDGTLTDLTPYIERELKNVYNRTLPTVRQIWGELRYPHEFYAEPATLEKDDIKTAKIATIAAEFTNEIGKFKFKIDMSKLMALIYSCVYWKEWWNRDPSKFGYIRNPETGERSQEPGEVDYDYISPFNCRPDPLGNIRDNWRHFIEGKRLPKSIVEDEFGLEPGSLASESDEDILPADDLKDVKEDTVIRKEYWERRSKKNPKGRFVVTAGGWLLYDGKNPAPNYGIPYWKLPGLIPDIRKKGCYESAIKILRAMQKNYNRLNSYIDEHIQNFGIKAMIPFGSLVHGELDAFRRAGVEYITYNSRVGQPYYQATPSLPESTIAQRTYIEREIETVISVRKISMAQWEKGVRASGVLFEGLKRQDEIVLMPTVEEYDNILPEIIKYRLSLIKKHYSEERMIRTVGKNRKISISFFRGSDLSGNEDIRVKSGVEIFTNRRLKYDAIIVMMEKGLIKDPRKALELMGLGKGLEEYMEDEFVNEQQASRYLEVMKTTDAYIDVHPDDNNEVHFTIFNNFRKSEEFETLPEKRKENIQKRIDELKMRRGAAEAPKPIEEGAPVAPRPIAETAPTPAPPVPTPETTAGAAGPVPAPSAEGGPPPEILAALADLIKV